jgi:outer membrane protein TolC
MSSPSKLMVLLMASLLSASPLYADTKRMQDVAALLGIEATGNPASKDAEAAVARLVEQSLRSHPRIKIREAELNASRARVDAAQGRYQPSLRVDGSAQQQNSKDMESDQRSRAESLGASLVLEENLYRGGLDAGQVDLARQDESLAEIQKIYEGEELAYRVARAAFAYNYRFFRQLIEEASLADATELRSLADRKFNAGQVGKIDVHLTGMRESAARSSAARAAIETQQDYLNLLNFLGPQESAEALTADLNALTKAALPYPSALPDLKVPEAPSLDEKGSLARQKRAEISLDQNYRARYLPRVDLVGRLGQDESSNWLLANDDLKDRNKNQFSSVQLLFSWNLWDRSQDHEIRAAAAEKTAAENSLEATRYETGMETKRLQRYITDLHKTLEISRDAYRQAGQLYDAQRRLYESGVIGIQPLMDAEREKRDAIRAWQQNVYELQVSLLNWQALQKGYLSRDRAF